MTTLVASPAGLPSLPPKMPTLLVPLPSALTTLPNQPAALGLGEAERADQRRRDALLGRDAGMRRLAGDLDLPVLLADRADDQVRRRAGRRR